MIGILLFYLFSSSVVLMYGIGVNRLMAIDDRLPQLTVSFIKSFFVSIITASLSFVCIKYLLVPVNLTEFYPFMAVILFILVSFIVEIFVSIGVSSSSSEFAVPFLSVLLSLNEGVYFSQVVVICICSIVSFYLFAGIIYSIRGRIDIHTPDAGLKTHSVLLLSLAVVVIALYGWNASWLNIKF